MFHTVCSKQYADILFKTQPMILYSIVMLIICPRYFAYTFYIGLYIYNMYCCILSTVFHNY